MKKNHLLAFILIFCLVSVCISSQCYAFGSLDFIQIKNESQITGPVYDETGLLSKEEQKHLTEKLTAIRSQYQCDVSIVVLSDTGYYNVREYMEAVYLRCGFGYGSEKSGIMLALSTAQRDWNLLTYGKGLRAVTDYGVDYISNQVVPYLSEDEFFKAFETFAGLAEAFLEEEAKGTPFDYDHPAKLTLLSRMMPYLLSFGIAFLIALIICISLLVSMRVAARRSSATNYMTPGSFQLTDSRDYYLYTSKVRTKHVEKKSSGGSSTDSHGFGGGGGKY